MRTDGKLTASVPLATACSARGRPLSEALEISQKKMCVVIMRNMQKPIDHIFSTGSSFNLATESQPSNLLKAVWNNGSFIYYFQWPLALRHAVNQIELSLCEPEIISSHLDTQTVMQHMPQLKRNGDQTF